ncbi:translocation/assembly module TamB domain-containing protein [Lewinella sp. JB7]|uniref:translocation/assembly module TamB domain-containing protein n=1 Tax=Lewinella sp. JB7 TaxID=2962887 RepID=UPI0020C950BD|nr:translocation/assembly module TamB domain-containing protein [Lewinella sp. JB7]MCP9237614.1 translocation/assembly module TamB [Lewinella sp. JB7]
MIASLLGLIVLLFLLVQLPFVQRKITTEVEKIARNTLQSDVGIGDISIKFPSGLTVDRVYVNNPAGDTIARLGHLGIGINMWSLIRSTAEINTIEINDVYANVITTESSSNIQFLLDAFLPVDTVAMADSPQADSVASSSGGWLVDLNGASLSLTNADIYYQDDPTGILADVTARQLLAEINEADLNAMRFDIDYLDLNGTDIAVAIGESSTPVDSTAEAVPIELMAGRITVAESSFRMAMDSLDLATEIPYFNLEGSELVMGDSISYRGELFQLREFALRMDTPAPPLSGPGMDFNHIALSDVEAEATDIAYIVDSLDLRLRQLSARERSGLTIQRTEGHIVYNPSYLGLQGFVLQTPHSELRSDDTAIKYDFTSSDLERMVARAQLDGHLGLRDIALLAPQYATESIVRNNIGQQIDFSVRANGTVAQLEIGRIQVDGPGIKVRASGSATDILDSERAGGRLFLREFSITPGPLLPLVPEGTLPPGIDWPQRIVAEGTATYRDDRLELDLYALENRVFGNGLNSRVRTSGVINGVQSYPRTRLNVRLDTLLATRATILAYVPPGTLPEDYTLPDFVRGSGSVSGPMDNLDVNLRLNLPGDSTYARINGNVRNALDPDQLALDLEVSDLGINIGDVRSILPDSMLPANLNLPDLRIRNARISGSLTDLNFDVPLETSNGDWNLRGRYDPTDLNVSARITGVSIPDLFTGPLRDTLQQLQLGLLDIRADVTGQLEPAMDLNIAAFVAETDGDSLLDLTALVTDRRYEARFDLMHPDMLVNGSGRYLLHEDSTAFVEALVNVERVELQQWGITPQRMEVSGNLVARSEGIDPYALDAFFRLDDFILRGAEGSSYVDSLLLTASMHDRENEIYLRSDVMDGDLVGTFDPLKTPEKLTQFITGYWDHSIRQPDPVEDGSKLDFTFKLKRPQVLTGGLVAGLTQLSPMNMSLLYRDARPELLFNLDLGELVFSGVEARDLHMKAIGDTASLNFTADWGDINYNDQVQLGRTVIAAETVDEELLVELKLYTEEDSLRHYLGAFIDQEGDSLTVRLEEEQILNFESWMVPATNLIAMAGPNLIINNLALRHGSQALLAETSDSNTVHIAFEDFDLRTPSRLVFSEEEVAGGILNGTVDLDNVLTNLGIRTDLTIDDFSWSGSVVGDVAADVTSDDQQNYRIDVVLTGEGNAVEVTGNYALNGPMDLLVDLERLQLSSAEPFSLGYLTETEGYLAGEIGVTGTIDAPVLDGSVAFQDASLVISLLGERFRMGENPITFSNQRITFTNGLSVYDSRGNDAVLTGNILLNSLTDIRLDMLLVAEDFTAINSTDDDNPDYYGTMSVDARVEIGGTATLPVLNVDATTNDGSDITYIYSVPSEGLVDNEGIVEFEEQYQWADIIRRDTSIDTDSLVAARTGVDMTINLDIKPNLLVTVVVDPATGQTFTGRAEGNLTLKINPDGSQEATGRVEVVQGRYDFIYQVINKELDIAKGSTVTFNGDITNPILDVTVRYAVKTSPLPLVEAMSGGSVSDAGTLRRKQTFYALIGLKGELLNSNLTTDVVYPEDVYGNLGISSITNALSTLRQDDSRLTTTTFQLLAFDGFNIPLIDQGGGDGTSLANTTLNNALGGYLNNLANKYVGFVELDFGLDSYQDADGQTNTNLRVSLRKTLFDDRVVISVDGVTGNEADEAAGTQQTYLDNITAEYLINDDGTFRLKFFNDRDRDILVGGNVLRYGGRLTFSKDFDRFFWTPNKTQK